MINLNDITSSSCIGEGGNWKVYRCILRNNSTIIIKEPKHFDKISIDKNIKNYYLLKNHNIQTVTFLEKHEWKGKQVLVTEDLKKSTYSFVSPNSVTTDSVKALEEFNKKINLLNHSFSQGSRVDSIEEQYFYKNKIKEIMNLGNLLNRVRQDIIKASESRISIYCDSYFFSINLNQSSSSIDYRIADWDNIEQYKDISFQEVYEANMKDFIDAIYTFVKLFVTEGENKVNYLSLISNLL